MRELVVIGVGAITILAGIYAMYRPRMFRSLVWRCGMPIAIIVVLAVMWVAAAVFSIERSFPR
jgi:hypothetical protein